MLLMLATGSSGAPPAPDTVTVTTLAYGGSAGTRLPWDSPSIRREGLVPGGTAGAPVAVSNQVNSSGHTAITARVLHTGSSIAVHLYRGTATEKAVGYRIEIDGVDVTGLVTSATSRTVRIEFGQVREREIRVEMAGMNFGGFDVAPGSNVTAPPAHVKLAVYGDSWVEGTSYGPDGNDPHIVHMGYLTGKKLGMDVYVHGIGGTGYVNGATATPPRDYGADTRLAIFETSVKPDWWVFFGTINDGNTDTTTVASTMFNRLATSVPASKLIVVGQESYSNGTNAGKTGDNFLRAAIATAPNVKAFISPRDEAWITGTGNTVTPTGDGNADQYHNGNNVSHLSLAGNAYYADRLKAALAPIIAAG